MNTNFGKGDVWCAKSWFEFEWTKENPTQSPTHNRMHLKLEMHLQRQVYGISNTKIETSILLDHVECVLFAKDPIHYKRVNSYNH